MKKLFALLATTLLIGLLTACTPTTEEETAMKNVADEMMEGNEMPAMNEGMDEMVEEMEVMMDGETYMPYSAEKIKEYKGKAAFALFFHAPWCSTCRAIEADLNENFKDLPENTHILKADYDSETELKKEHGITMQSTLVFFDKEGNEVSRLQGASTFEQIKEALMSSM